MRWLRTMLTVVLAVAWMPLTAHCHLERLTGLEMLRCASVETPVTPVSSDCDHHVCCGWESTQYHLPHPQPSPVLPLLAVISPAPVALEHSRPAQWCAEVLTAPPRPPRPWHFAVRAALPVRAPSVAS